MVIKYRSTRGKQSGLSFQQVVLGGLATDKGLYIPESIPQMSLDEIESLRKLSYAELSYEVIRKFVSPEDVPSASLKDIVNRSFSTFRHPDVTPVKKLKEYWVLELFHGPTFAFKDVALQFLGNLFEYFLTKGDIQKEITILGATSGDTGSAAIHGLRGKKNVNCFILFPNGKVTEIQERQMTTIPDQNVHCLSIDGNFDDAQAIVKAAFNDARFREEVKLGAINSINWARVLAQITYYFYSWLRVTDDLPASERKPLLNYAVPTGNFGDILAGYYAKRMGLPLGSLVVCTNENDVLHRFLSTGTYSNIPSHLTIAPSMDISVSSNFERYLFYLADESSDTLTSWMDIFEKTGIVSVPPHLLERARAEFKSHPSSKEDIIKAMRSVYDAENYLLCPHTATATVACRALKMPAATTVILATAHPAKFEEAVLLALEDTKMPPRPKELNALFSLPVRVSHAPSSLSHVQGFVRAKRISKGSASSWMYVAFLTLAAAVSIGFVVARNASKN